MNLSEEESSTLSSSTLPTVHSITDESIPVSVINENDHTLSLTTELPLPSSSSTSGGKGKYRSSPLCTEILAILGHNCRKYTRGKYLLLCGRFITLGAVIISLYYFLMILILLGHTYQITDKGTSLGKIIGFGLKQVRLITTDNNIHPVENDQVHLHADIHVRNGLYTSLIIRDLQVRITSAGLSSSMLHNSDTSHNIFTRTFDPALFAELNGDDMIWVADNQNNPRQDPWCAEPLSGSFCRGPEGSPTVAVTLQSTHIQQWLQTIVGLVTGMSIAPGYEPYLDRSNMADIRLRGKATIVPLALSPFGLQITGEAKLSVSNALRYIGSAATGGTGRWSFTSFLSAAGVKKGGAEAYGIYKDIATRIGAQTLSVRLPVDITGDLFGYYQWLRETTGITKTAANVIEAGTGVGVNDPTKSGYNVNSNTCCCSESSSSSTSTSTTTKRILREKIESFRSLQSDNGIGDIPTPLSGTSANIEQLLTSSTEFPRPQPYSMTLGVAKINTTGFLDHREMNLGVLFCRTLTDIVSSTDARLMKDLAMIWDTIDKTGSTRYVTPGTTIIGTKTSEDIYQNSLNKDTIVSPIQTFEQRILSQTQYRRPDICSTSLASTGTKLNSLFGIISSSSPVLSTLRLHAMAGRQGYPNIYGALKNTGKIINNKNQQYPSYLASFAEVSLAIDSTFEALGLHVRLNDDHVEIMRQVVRELIIGEDPSLILPNNVNKNNINRTIPPGSPRVNRPISPHGKARIWMCHPQQIPIGVVTSTVNKQGNVILDRNLPYIHPLGSLIDGLMTCVLSPWLDAMTATVGGIVQEFNTTGWVVTEKELLTLIQNKKLGIKNNLSYTGNIIINDDSTFTTTTGIVYVTANRTEYFPPSTTVAVGSVCDQGTLLMAESSGTVHTPSLTANSNTITQLPMVPHYGWSTGISINHSYAVWNILGNNGKRNSQSSKGINSMYTNGKTSSGSWARVSSTNTLKYDLSNGISYDPPWIYVRSTLEQGVVQSTLTGSGTTYSTFVEDGGRTLPVTSTVTTSLISGVKNSSLAQQVCNTGSSNNSDNQRRRRLTSVPLSFSNDNNEPVHSSSVSSISSIPSSTLSVKTPSVSPPSIPLHNPSTVSSASERKLGAANLPSLSSVQEDSMGGLLAAIASWYSDEIEPRQYEELVWDSVPLYNGYMSNDNNWDKDLRSFHRFQRSIDPCFQILHHDIAVMGSCCSNKTENMYNAPFLAESSRTLSVSGIVRLKQKTLRTILFRSIGDIQPIVFPTLLLKHIQNISFTNKGRNRNNEPFVDTITASTGIAAVARACAVTIPDYDGNNQPTQPYGNVNGAYFAAGDEYRVRLRIVLSVIDPELFWSAGVRSGVEKSSMSSASAARGLMDLFFNGPSLRSIDALSNTNVNDESAELLLRILQSQFSSTGTTTATEYTKTSTTDEKSVPLPVAPNRNDPVLGNITGLLSGINWRLTLSSYTGTINLLRERCLSLYQYPLSSLQCFRTVLPPVPTENNDQLPTFYPNTNGKSSSTSSTASTKTTLSNSNFPLLADPLLYRLFSGLSLMLRLPTLRDTAEFVLGGDRSWPQQSSALLELMNIYDNLETEKTDLSLTDTYGMIQQIQYELSTLVGISDTLPIQAKYPPYFRNTIDNITVFDTYNTELTNSRNSSFNGYRRPLQLGTGLLLPLFGILAGDNPTIFGSSELTGNSGTGFTDNDSLQDDANRYGVFRATVSLTGNNITTTITNSSNNGTFLNVTNYTTTTTIGTFLPYFGTECPVTSYCLPPTENVAWTTWYYDTARSYTNPSRTRGPLPSCTYRLPRFACTAWKYKNYSTLFRVPDIYCSNLMDAVCEEWDSTCSYISVIRTQDIPVLYINLPETDLGQGSASIQIMPRCDNSVRTGAGSTSSANNDSSFVTYDEEGYECDPWVWTNTITSTDPSLSSVPIHTNGEPFPLHAGRLSFTITKTLSTAWQTLNANAAVFWCPQDTINSVSPNVFSYTTNVRSLPAARTVLISALLTRTRLLTRVTSRHRQFDYALPFRLFSEAMVSAHHVPILTLQDFKGYPILNLPTVNHQGIKATISNQTLAQPYAFLRTHMYAVANDQIIYGSDGIHGTSMNSNENTVYIGILLINTLPSETIIDRLGDIAISTLVQLNTTVRDDRFNTSRPLVMRIPYTYSVFSNSSNETTDTTGHNGCSRLGITLMGPPKEIVRYGIKFPLDIARMIDTETVTVPSTVTSTVYFPTSSCGYETRNQSFPLNIMNIAASTGIHPSLLTVGINQRWISHISIPLLNVSNSESWLTKVPVKELQNTLAQSIRLSSTGSDVITADDITRIEIRQDNTLSSMFQSWIRGHRMHYPGSTYNVSSPLLQSSSRQSSSFYSSSTVGYTVSIESATVIPSVKGILGSMVRPGNRKITILQQQIQQHYQSLYNRLYFSDSLRYPFNQSTLLSIGEKCDYPEQYDQDTYIGRLFHLTQGYVGIKVWSVPLVYMKLVPSVTLPDSNGTITGTVFLPIGIDTYIPHPLPTASIINPVVNNSTGSSNTNSSPNTTNSSSSFCPYILPNGTCVCPPENKQTFQREPDAGFTLTVEYVAVDISNSSGAFILLLAFFDLIAIIVCCADVVLQRILHRVCFCCCRKPPEDSSSEEKDDDNGNNTVTNYQSEENGNISVSTVVSTTVNTSVSSTATRSNFIPNPPNTALTLRQVEITPVTSSRTSSSSNRRNDETVIEPRTNGGSIQQGWVA